MTINWPWVHRLVCVEYVECRVGREFAKQIVILGESYEQLWWGGTTDIELVNHRLETNQGGGGGIGSHRENMDANPLKLVALWRHLSTWNDVTQNDVIDQRVSHVGLGARDVTALLIDRFCDEVIAAPDWDKDARFCRKNVRGDIRSVYEQNDKKNCESNAQKREIYVSLKN